MLIIEDNRVILRDFIESDIEKRIIWETVETEWQQWDAPWEYDGLTDAQKQKNLAEYVETMKGWVKKYQAMPDSAPRHGFQICAKDGDYIGWCNSYTTDDDYTYSPDGSKCAVGIDINEAAQRGKGCASHALCLFIDYLTEHGESDIYTQTWSGNTRMIRLAEKLGFEECRRKKGIRSVRGQNYDGLTFKLDREKYSAAKKSLYE